MEVIYVINGVASKYNWDSTNAYVTFEGRMIFKKDHPNVFNALAHEGHRRFDYRVVPMSGVELTKIETI